MRLKRQIAMIISIGAVIAVLVSMVVLTGCSDTGSAKETSATSFISIDAEILTGLKKLAALDKEYVISAGEGSNFVIYANDDLNEEMKIHTPHEGEINALSVSPDKRMIVSGDKNGKILVWDIENASVKVLDNAHKGEIKDIAFSDDGTFFITASKDRIIKVWDSKTLRNLNVLKGHKSYVLSVDISPEGDKIASVGMDNRLIIWNTSTGKEIKSKSDSHYKAVNQVSFSPDGNYVYTASADAIIKVWDIEKLESTITIKGHTNEVLSIAISPDGKKILSAGRDKALYSFDIETGEKISTVELPNNVYVSGLQFSKDGNTVFAADKSGDLVSIDYNKMEIVNQKKAEPIYDLGKF